MRDNEELCYDYYDVDWEKDYKRKQSCKEIAEYYVSYRCSIREVAREFMVSKSTVHRWFHTILPYLEDEGFVEDKSLWEEVQYQLSYNKKHAIDRMIKASRDRRYH